MGREQQRRHNARRAEPHTPIVSQFNSATTTDAARTCLTVEACCTFHVEDTHRVYGMTVNFCANAKKKAKKKKKEKRKQREKEKKGKKEEKKKKEKEKKN